jgi:hypothetical protein
MTRPTKPKKKPSGPSGKHLHAGVLVRAPDAEREAWEAAAAAAGLDRSSWIRGELNAAAARQLGRLGVIGKLVPQPAWHDDADDFQAMNARPKKKDRAKKG